jgi:hypothetical protein
MNLILRTHENFSDPVWSVIFMVILACLGASYYIYYILNLAFSEYEDGERPKH